MIVCALSVCWKYICLIEAVALSDFCLKKWSCPLTSLSSPPCLPYSLLSFLPCLPAFGTLPLEYLGQPCEFPLQRVRAKSDRQTLWWIFSWKSCMLLVTQKWQNQQSTTYLCHNWNSKLTLYTNKQKVRWELLKIWLNLEVFYHYWAPSPWSNLRVLGVIGTHPGPMWIVKKFPMFPLVSTYFDLKAE